MASLLDLPGTAEQILALFAEQLTTLDVELPERQYVAPGSLVPFDGEQLVVNLIGIDQGQPGAPYTGTYVPSALNLAAQFSIGLVRLTPMLSGQGPLETMVPEAGELDQAGQAGMSDAAALIQAASAIHEAHSLVGPGEGFVIGPLQTLGPEGGMAGCRLLLNLSLS